MDEIVYVLTNEAMPRYIKIGRTSNLINRLQQLNTTSVPFPFECFYACTVNDSALVEKALHDAFLDHRINTKREFFELAPERAVAALRPSVIDDVTPRTQLVGTRNEKIEVNQARQRRSAINFSSIGVLVDSILTFSRDDSIHATVIDNRSIEFSGERTSLSTAAQRILGYNYPVSGTQYWKYKGQLLDDLRRRVEEQ